MKKLIITIAILLFATPAFGWNLFFIDQLEDIGEGEMGFVLGTYNVSQSQVVIIGNVGLNYLFIYVTNNNTLANEAYSFPEYRAERFRFVLYRYRGILWIY